MTWHGMAWRKLAFTTPHKDLPPRRHRFLNRWFQRPIHAGTSIRLITNLHHLTTGDANLASIDICQQCLTQSTPARASTHIYLLAPTPSSDVEYTLRDSFMGAQHTRSSAVSQSCVMTGLLRRQLSKSGLR